MSSLDLVLTPSSIRSHVEYLQQFHSIYTNPLTNTDPVSLHSIQRYQDFLSLYFTHQKTSSCSSHRLLPPIDVALVWHTHLLNPHHYYKHCIHKYGTILLYQLHEKDQITQEEIQYSRQLCKENGIDYDPPSSSNLPTTPSSSSLSSLASYLLPALHRQCSFTSKMHSRRFTDQQLLSAIHKYKQFLAFIAATGTVAVPTLEIDLIWHTHQLFPASYIVSTASICGYVVNHDDQIEAEELGVSWKITQIKWKEMYGEEYLTSKIVEGGGKGHCGSACGGRQAAWEAGSCGSCSAGKCKTSLSATCGSACGAGKCKHSPSSGSCGSACGGGGKCKPSQLSSCSACGAGKCKHQPAQCATCQPKPNGCATCQPKPNSQHDCSCQLESITELCLKHVANALTVF